MNHAVLSLVATFALLAGCVASTSVQGPSRVQDLRADQEPGGVRLSWTENPVGKADHFTIYKNGTSFVNVSAPLRSYLDKTVKPGVTVRYTVRAVMEDGRLGERSNIVDFTLRQSLSLVQDEQRWVNRGYANLSVGEVSPGIRWDQLLVFVDGKKLERNDFAYLQHRASWTHSDPKDALADLGERMRLLSPENVVRNATLEVRLAGGATLLRQELHGRPTINLTMKQDRNATEGLVSFTALDVAWYDQNRDVSASWPGLVARWSALEVLVNGTKVPYHADARLHSWTHEAPSDDILREGGRLILRLPPSLLHPGAVVIVRDAEAGEESYRRVLS